MNASASYFAYRSDKGGQASQWMWTCDVCSAVGLESTEPGVVKAMNTHVEDEHPDSGYVPTPVPK